MSYSAFDPRQDIISKIGYDYDVDGDGDDESCISFSYPDGEWKGDTCYVPMFLPSECRTGELPYMPFIEVTLVDAPGEVHNISGNVRRDEAYIDFNIYATNTDKINQMKTWMVSCKNEVVDKIMQNRNDVSNCTWVEPVDTGREIIEQTGQKVIFHHVISLYAMNYYGE